MTVVIYLVIGNGRSDLQKTGIFQAAERVGMMGGGFILL
jgi:hypothetical protein